MHALRQARPRAYVFNSEDQFNSSVDANGERPEYSVVCAFIETHSQNEVEKIFRLAVYEALFATDYDFVVDGKRMMGVHEVVHSISHTGKDNTWKATPGRPVNLVILDVIVDSLPHWFGQMLIEMDGLKADGNR